MVASILEGVKERNDFRSFVNIQNEFGLESAKSVNSLIERKRGLDELRIINCDCNPLAALTVVSCILERKSIKRLALVNASIDEKVFEVLINILKTCKSLIEIDLSWNSITRL